MSDYLLQEDGSRLSLDDDSGYLVLFTGLTNASVALVTLPALPTATVTVPALPSAEVST